MIVLKLPKNIRIKNSDVLKEPVIEGWKSFIPCWCMAGNETGEKRIPVIVRIGTHGNYHYHCSKTQYKDYVAVEECNDNAEYSVMENLDNPSPLPNRVEYFEGNIGYEILTSKPQEKYYITTEVVVALRDIKFIGKRFKYLDGNYNFEEDIILAKRFYLPSTHFREAHGFLIECYKYWEMITGD